jgi:hypothetical protein
MSIKNVISQPTASTTLEAIGWSTPVFSRAAIPEVLYQSVFSSIEDYYKGSFEPRSEVTTN